MGNVECNPFFSCASNQSQRQEQPGEVLQEWLQGIAITEAARKLGVTRRPYRASFTDMLELARIWRYAWPMH